MIQTNCVALVCTLVQKSNWCNAGRLLLQGVPYSPVSGTSASEWAQMTPRAPQENHWSQDAGALRAPELKALFPNIPFCNDIEHSHWYWLPLCTLSASSVFPTITALKFFFQAAVHDKCKTVTTSTFFFLSYSFISSSKIPYKACKSHKEEKDHYLAV